MTETTATLWPCPPSLPEDLWPVAELSTITPTPSGWVTVYDLSLGEGRVRSRQCGVTDSAASTTSIPEPFASMGASPGCKEPQVNVLMPFLWFWDAHPLPHAGWNYRDSEGFDRPLLRYTCTPVSDEWSNWSIDVRGDELRHYLAIEEKLLIFNYAFRQLSTITAEHDFSDSFHTDWADLQLHVQKCAIDGNTSTEIGLSGTYIVQ